MTLNNKPFTKPKKAIKRVAGHVKFYLVGFDPVISPVMKIFHLDSILPPRFVHLQN